MELSTTQESAITPESAVTQDSAPTDATTPSVGPSLDERLLDDAMWWVAEARRERWSQDRLWACLACAACGRRFTATFRCARSPWTGGDDAPLYTNLAELLERLTALAAGRARDVIDASEWRTATRCGCGAPPHRTGVVGAALLHAMIAGGSLVVLAEAPTDGQGRAAVGEGGATRCFVHLPGEGALREIEATEAAIEEAFGRPLTLAPAWARMLAQLPPPAGQAAGTRVEPGVIALAVHGDAAESAQAVRAVAAAQLGTQRHLLVFVEPSTVRTRAWPAALAPLADHLERGAALALVLDYAAVLRQLRALARAHYEGDVIEEGDGWLLRTKELAWPISVFAIGQSMVQLGRTLPEAAALMLAMAWAAAQDRLATLRAMCDVVPGSFEVDGTRATGLRPDGSRGRTIELTALPPFVSALPPEELVREAAFLLDAAPSWADRARVCPCGAAATLEARIVAWPWTGDPSATPHVLEVFEVEGFATVVALACERHVRVPAATELTRLGVDEARVASRLVADAPDARQRVRAHHSRRDGRTVAVLVEGAMVGSLVVSPARIAALHDAVGAPFRDASALSALALGVDRLGMVDADREGAETVLWDALRAGRATPELGPVIRRRVELSVERVGTFDVAKERR